MLLCLDIGNTQIFGGVFAGEELLIRFRRNSKQRATSDELGIFLKNVIRENGIDESEIQHIAFCSVVPELDYSITAACKKYFKITPFVLQPGVKTGLKIKVATPTEVGSDRIANAIAATNLYPNQPIIVVDFGTATSFCAITADNEYLGGAILPGLRLSIDALQSGTAKLSSVAITKPETAVGRTTTTNIQSGLYFGSLGMIRELTQRITTEAFANTKPLVIGTGGFAHLFEHEDVFSKVLPDLVLHGVRVAFSLN